MRYSGAFHQDKKHGKGIYTYADGNTVKGLFENDECKDGLYTGTLESGQKYQTVMKDFIDGEVELIDWSEQENVTIDGFGQQKMKNKT